MKQQSQHIIHRSITKNEEDYFNTMLAHYQERIKNEPDNRILRQTTTNMAQIVRTRSIRTWEQDYIENNNAEHG